MPLLPRTPTSAAPRAGALLGLLLLARGASAQDAVPLPAHLRALATPSATVGTCLPLRPSQRVGPDGAPRRGARLAMTSRTPAARREMTVVTTRDGRLASYQETTSATDLAHDRGSGETVLAMVAADGRLRGTHITTTIAMPSGTSRTRRPAALQDSMARTRSTSQSAPLDEATQRRVRELATRCALSVWRFNQGRWRGIQVGVAGK